MKKLLLTTMVLGSTVAVAACTGTTSDADLDGTLTQAPYAEERTVGATGGNVNLGKIGNIGNIGLPKVKAPAAVVRSAEPVFESSQVK